MATTTRPLALRPRPSRRRRRRRKEPPATPTDAARAASLRYVSDDQPGIRRQRRGRGFIYLDESGRSVRERSTLARIRSLAVPPAWNDVWICSTPDGHLQATGRDARGRKQYRYHARWREARDETKYGRMALFGRALPRIRARVREDLARTGLPREKVLAVIVRLLETTFMRVGNDEYARQNGSFGLTTLQNRHVQVDGSSIRFRFRGKSGAFHAVRVDDRRLASLVRRLRDLPGQELFQYHDESEEPQRVNSADVNAYLREIAGDDFTAKDFRTWAGTLLAARSLSEATAEALPASAAERRSTALRVVESVARQLGNTPAICRKSYIHPLVLAAHSEPELREQWRQSLQDGPEDADLSADERTLLRFLRRR